jgi:hypothetical protein
MKKTSFLLLASCLFFIACSDEHLIFNSSEKVQDYSTEQRSNDDGNGTEIDCVGACETEKCYARFLIQDQTFDCLPCTDCKMVISYLKEQDDYLYQSNFEEMGIMFSERLSTLHDGQEAKITKILMQHSDSNEFIQLEYYVGDDKESTFSVGYLSRNVVQGGPIIEVDCSGNCGDNPGICTEVFNTRTGEVYCKCESDNCKMTVTSK